MTTAASSLEQRAESLANSDSLTKSSTVNAWSCRPWVFLKRTWQARLSRFWASTAKAKAWEGRFVKRFSC
jgi:hypothetical protein